MKYIITERQSRLIEESEKILRVPPLSYFNNSWEILQKFLERRGYPPYSISGDLDLSYKSIESLGNLKHVGGYLRLDETPIKSLGNLKHVGGYLSLYICRQFESLGNLEYVWGDLDLEGTPLSKTMSEDEIRSKVNVEGDIYL